MIISDTLCIYGWERNILACSYFTHTKNSPHLFSKHNITIKILRQPNMSHWCDSRVVIANFPLKWLSQNSTCIANLWLGAFTFYFKGFDLLDPWNSQNFKFFSKPSALRFSYDFGRENCCYHKYSYHILAWFKISIFYFWKSTYHQKDVKDSFALFCLFWFLAALEVARLGLQNVPYLQHCH